MSVDQQYEAALAKVRTFTKRPTDTELLDLYGLFKQASFGDNGTKKPSVFDVKGVAKWESWDKRKGMSAEEAKKAYTALVEKFSASYS